MSREPFNREKFKANFREFLKENRELVEASYTTLEELAKDPDFIADEPVNIYEYEVVDRVIARTEIRSKVRNR